MGGRENDVLSTQNPLSGGNSFGDGLLARGLEVKVTPGGGAASTSGSSLLTQSSYLTESEWTQIATLKPKFVEEYPELNPGGASATGAVVNNLPARTEAPAAASTNYATWLTSPRLPTSSEEPAPAPALVTQTPVATALAPSPTQNKSSSLEAPKENAKNVSAGSGNKTTADPTAGYLPTPKTQPGHNSGGKSARTPLEASNPAGGARTPMEASGRALAGEGTTPPAQQPKAAPPAAATAPSAVLRASTNTAVTNEIFGLLQFARGADNNQSKHSSVGGAGTDKNSNADGGSGRSDGVAPADASTPKRDPAAMQALKDLGISEASIGQAEKTADLVARKIQEFNEFCQPTDGNKNTNSPLPQQMCLNQLANLAQKENKKSVEECLELKIQINSPQISTSLLFGIQIKNQEEKNRRAQAKNKNRSKKQSKDVEVTNDGTINVNRMRQTASQEGATISIGEIGTENSENSHLPFDPKKMTEQSTRLSEEFRSFYQTEVSPSGECRDGDESSEAEESNGGKDFLSLVENGFKNAAQSEAFAKAAASRDFLFGFLAAPNPNCYIFDSGPVTATGDKNPAAKKAATNPCSAGIENAKNPTQLDKMKTLAFFNTIESINDLGEPSFVDQIFRGITTPKPFTREFTGSKAMLAYRRVEQFLFTAPNELGLPFKNFIFGCNSNGAVLDLLLSLENDLRDSAAQCGSKDALNALSLLTSAGSEKSEGLLFSGYYGLSKHNLSANSPFFVLGQNGQIQSSCPEEQSASAQKNGFISSHAASLKPLDGRNLSGLTALGLENPGNQGQKNSEDCKKIKARYEFALGFILNNSKALEAWQLKQMSFEGEKNKTKPRSAHPE